MVQHHAQIHPSAIIETGAKIGNNVTIGPFCLIGPHVIVEDNVTIKSHVCIDGHTKIGQGTTVWPQAVIGTQTQDLKFRGEKTFVVIGKNCQIRECVTINSSCGEDTTVEIGDSCLIMAACHVAHNCIIGNRVIMANGTLLAGHVTIEDCAVLGGMSAVHQFSRIGCYAMVGGMSRVTHDVMPYSLGAGSPYQMGGINLVGIKRHGFSPETRKELAQAFRIIYRTERSLRDSLQEIEATINLSPEILHILKFCRETKRGLIGMSGMTATDAIMDAKSKETSDCVEAL